MCMHVQNCAHMQHMSITAGLVPEYMHVLVPAPRTQFSNIRSAVKFESLLSPMCIGPYNRQEAACSPQTFKIHIAINFSVCLTTVHALSALLLACVSSTTSTIRTCVYSLMVCPGTFQGKSVSIVSTMMGMANMDFVIRECQAIVEGSLAMIRLGTCGAVQPPAGLGSFLVASEGSICIRCASLLIYRLSCSTAVSAIHVGSACSVCLPCVT